MRIGYARVSTKDQSLDLQFDALKEAGCDKIFSEKESGTKNDRTELSKALDYAREGDALVVYKLDRLGRSTKKLIELSEELQERGIELISIRDSIDTTTAMGKAMFRMLAVLAEMERDIIAERTRAGLDAARARGRKGGRPKANRKRVQAAVDLYKARLKTVSEIEEITGVSRATLYRTLKREEAPFSTEK